MINNAHEIAVRLDEIKEEIKVLMRECEMMLRRTGMPWERARSYWYAHILSALDDEEYPSGSATTMQETIEELENEDIDEEEGREPGELRGPMGSVRSMRFTNTYTRIANIPMRMDAGELREHLAHQLYQWQLEGSKGSDWVKSFWVKIKQLAKLVGKTKEEVHRELQEDAANMGDEEDLDLDRTSAKGKAVNPWAVCHSQLGPKKTEKFESCVQDVKSKNKIKKD